MLGIKSIGSELMGIPAIKSQVLERFVKTVCSVGVKATLPDSNVESRLSNP